MSGVIRLIWKRGVVGTFLSGLFAILPILITIAVLSWAATQIHRLFGPTTAVGRGLSRIGGQFATDEAVALAIGWLIVLLTIWLLGLFVRARTRGTLDRAVNSFVARIPIVKGIYGTAAQVVGMLQKDDNSEMKRMGVVFCTFGANQAAGFLGLLPSPEVFRFADRLFHIVYVPTAPLMSGWVVFVPTENVQHVDLSADGLMQICVSLGVLAPQVMPPAHKIS